MNLDRRKGFNIFKVREIINPRRKKVLLATILEYLITVVIVKKSPVVGREMEMRMGFRKE